VGLTSLQFFLAGEADLLSLQSIWSNWSVLSHCSRFSWTGGPYLAHYSHSAWSAVVRFISPVSFWLERWALISMQS